MPTRRKATESQAPATTPKKSKNKNGGGMGVSQKYTAYVKERPTDFSREEEILQQLLENSLQDNDSSDYTGKILLIPPLPLDHGVGTRGIDDNQTNQTTPMNHHHPGPGIFRRGYDSLVGLLAKGLDLIGFTIFLIFWGTRSGFELVWRNLPRRNSKSNNRFLIFLILITILIILLISSEGSKTVLNRLLPSHLRFWDVTTYKIQFQHYDDYNHNNDSDSSITLTYEDLRKIIETEVRNHLKKSEGEKGVSSSPVGSAEIRNLVSHEVKQITNEYKHVISSEVKKEIKHIRTDNPRLRGNIKEDYILEIIRNEARKVVAEALLVFSQDKLNKPDFALHSGGAKVMSRYTSKTYEKWPNEWYKKVFAYLTGRVVRGKPPVTAISPNTHVGECWPFPGQEGQLAILLNRRVYVTAVTYDHVSRDVAVEVQSAPKEFEVWGIVDDGVKGYKHEMNDDPDEEIYMESTDDECSVRQDGEFVPDKNKNHLSKNNYSNDDSNLANDELHIDNLGSSPLHLFLGSFTYNISSLPVQTFEVPQDANKPVRTVIMKVLNNWGKPGYTCLYRFRVHGNPADKSDN